MTIQKYDSNSKNVLKEILEQPKSYLKEYFDEIKTRVDFHYEKTLANASDNVLKQNTSNEWVKIIDVVEKCRVKCLNNTLSYNLTNEIKKCQSAPSVVKELKSKINCCLLSNDSYFVFQLMVESSEKLVIYEEGLTKTEIKALIECFKNDPVEFKFNNFDKSEFNIVKMNLIWEEICVSKNDIIFIDSIKNRNKIKVNYKPVAERNCYSSNEKYPLLKLEPKHFEQYSNLEFLTIRNTDLHELNCDSFKYLTNLKSLKLKEMSVKDFKLRGIYKLESSNEFIELECLKLNSIKSKCDIISVLDNFSALKSLKSLALIRCNIKEINEKFFINLKNLEELNLSYNKEMRIKDGCFKSLSKLKLLDLTSYKGDSLSKSFFSGLSSLETLNLGSTKFSTVEKDCFHELINLKELDLESFKLDIPRVYHDRESYFKSRDPELIFCKLGAFAPLRNLEHLNLTFVECLRYKANAFIGMENLETLNLVRIRNADFEAYCFNGLRNLNSIDFYDAGFIQLVKDMFIGLDNLELLDFERTALRLEVGCFNGLPRLKKLNLVVCYIDVLERNVFDGLLSLETLNLNGNQTKLNLEEGCFNGLKNLKKLNLAGGEIEKLKKDMFIEFENLEELYLNDNIKLTFEKDCFKNLKKLKKLNLSYCDIDKLNKWLFDDLINLESLDLSDNKNLIFEEGLLKQLKNLKNLTLESRFKLFRR